MKTRKIIKSHRKVKEMRGQAVTGVIYVDCKATKTVDRRNNWVKGRDAQSHMGMTVQVITGDLEGLESWW